MNKYTIIAKPVSISSNREIYLELRNSDGKFIQNLSGYVNNSKQYEYCSNTWRMFSPIDISFSSGIITLTLENKKIRFAKLMTR